LAVGTLLSCLTAVLAWWIPKLLAVGQAESVMQTSRDAAGNAETSAQPAEISAPTSREARRAEWDGEIEWIRRDIYQLERELQEPASSLARDDRRTMSAIDTELDALEREINRRQ
jgi:hypothetical protein